MHTTRSTSKDIKAGENVNPSMLTNVWQSGVHMKSEICPKLLIAVSFCTMSGLLLNKLPQMTCSRMGIACWRDFATMCRGPRQNFIK